MVDKMENPITTNKFQITFDYFGVHKNSPGIHLEFNFKIHDHLSDLKYGYLFVINLKHVYLTINLYPDDRDYFTFTISGINQI